MDGGQGIAVDGTGNVYITGETRSTDLPVKNAYQSTYGGGNFYGDGFVTKFSSSGSTLVYSTYLGGTMWDAACDIAVDSAGITYITGWTVSWDFPTLNAYEDTAPGGGYYGDAFVTKLAATGSSLIYSTFLGGESAATGIAIDGLGHAYIAGAAREGFPTTPGAFDTTHNGGPDDAFVTKLYIGIVNRARDWQAYR